MLKNWNRYLLWPQAHRHEQHPRGQVGSLLPSPTRYQHCSKIMYRNVWKLSIWTLYNKLAQKAYLLSLLSEMTMQQSEACSLQLSLFWTKSDTGWLIQSDLCKQSQLQKTWSADVEADWQRRFETLGVGREIRTTWTVCMPITCTQYSTELSVRWHLPMHAL